MNSNLPSLAPMYLMILHITPILLSAFEGCYVKCCYVYLYIHSRIPFYTLIFHYLPATSLPTSHHNLNLTMPIHLRDTPSPSPLQGGSKPSSSGPSTSTIRSIWSRLPSCIQRINEHPSISFQHQYFRMVHFACNSSNARRDCGICRKGWFLGYRFFTLCCGCGRYQGHDEYGWAGVCTLCGHPCTRCSRNGREGRCTEIEIALT